MIYGQDDYRYELIPNWGEAALEKWDLSNIPSVVIDNDDNVYVACRSASKVFLLSSEGELLNVFAEDICRRMHHACLDSKGRFYLVDETSHVVYRFNKSFQIDMVIGEKDVPSETGCPGRNYLDVTHGGLPFHNPTGVAVAKNGDIYISDGYGNSRVHKFSENGTLLNSWGEPGAGRGEFHLPHAVTLSPKEDLLFVTDRENGRIQLFDLDGNYINELSGLYRPTSVIVTDDSIVVSELVHSSCFVGAPSRVKIFNRNGNLISTLVGETEFEDSTLGFHAAHGIALDGNNSLYVTDIGKNQIKPYFGIKKYQRV